MPDDVENLPRSIARSSAWLRGAPLSAAIVIVVQLESHEHRHPLALLVDIQPRAAADSTSLAVLQLRYGGVSTEQLHPARPDAI